MNHRAFVLPPLVAITCSLMASAASAKDESFFGTRDQPVATAPVTGDLVVVPVLAEKLPQKTFKIGHVGEPGQPAHEDLSLVFKAFQAQYTAGQDGKILSAVPWKDSGLFEITVTLQQDSQQGLYLLGNDAAHCIFVKTSESTAWVVGEKLHLYAYQTGLQEWTDAAGTVQKSSLYEPVVFPFSSVRQDSPTRKQFVAALRAGQSFTVLVPEAGGKDSPPRLIVQKLIW